MVVSARRPALRVTDEYEDGSELIEATREWAGTRFDEGFAQRIGQVRSPVRLHQNEQAARAAGAWPRWLCRLPAVLAMTGV
jgi:hypothetical protein